MLNTTDIPHKTKQFFFVLIKLSIVVGAFYFIYNKLTNNSELDFSVFIDFLSKNDVFSLKNGLSLLFLTIFNWFFEIKKWQNLVGSVKKISFFEATTQSLAALTASLFTPNRIGDYGAKAIYFERTKRSKILLLNLLSNIAQMSITLILGVIGFILFITSYDTNITSYKLARLIMYGLVILFTVGYFGYANKTFEIRGFSLNKIITFIKQIPTHIHVKNFGFSLIRYMIFSFQFYYLLLIFKVDLDYFSAMTLITTMYIMVSIIPTIFIFDVVVKGSIALYLFDFAEVNNLTILCVTTLMWLLNFVLPSIFGSYYVLNFNFSNLTKLKSE